MITYLQQSKTNKSNFLVVNDAEKATHFRKDAGALKTINQLITNVPVGRDEEPLVMPVINFSNKTEQNNSNMPVSSDEEPLKIPIMNFGNEVNSNKNNSNDDETLLMPVMEF